MADTVGLRSDDLNAALRGLAKVDREATKAAVQVLRDESIRVQKLSRARMKAKPGGGRYKTPKAGAIGRFANRKGAGITLNARNTPWINAAEFGSRRGWTPTFKGRGRRGGSRVSHAGGWSRRVFPPWRGNQFVLRGASGPGWIVQPTIRRELPKIEENLAEGLEDVIVKAMRQQGLESYG